MRQWVWSAVVSLAGAVVMGAFVQSASAATITYTQSVAAFSASNPSPIPFNPLATVVQGTFSNALAGSNPDDRSPYQNADGSYCTTCNGGLSDATKAYSAIQGYPTSIETIVTYNINEPINTLTFLWGSPDTFNVLSFWNGNPEAGGTELGSISQDAVTGIVSPSGLPLLAEATGHDLMTFTDKGGTFDYLMLTTTTNAFEYTFELIYATPTAAALPAALPLFASGLGVIGLLGWRRKWKASPVAAA